MVTALKNYILENNKMVKQMLLYEKQLDTSDIDLLNLEARVD